jgi:hypothetical protein
MTTLRPNGRINVRTFPCTDSDNFIRGEVNFNSPGVAAGATTNIRIGRLPQNADIVGIKVRTVTPFAGPATATLSVGVTPAAYVDIFAAASVAAALGSVTMAAGALTMTATDAGDTDVYAQLILGAGAPTAGKVRVFIDYTLPGVQ